MLMGVLIWPTAANFLLLSCYFPATPLYSDYPDNLFVLMIADLRLTILN